MDYSLKEILDNVEQIREAIYGEEVRESISDSIEMMAYEADTIQGFKDGVDKTLADFKSQYEQNFRDFADSIHRDMNQFETKINEDFAGFKSEVNREINNHKTEMDNKFFEFKHSVHLTIADFTNDMTVKMDTIQDEWIKFQQNTSLEISNFKMEMQNKYQEFTKQILADNSALKESVKTDIAGMKNDIMKFEETTTQTLAQYQEELGGTITSWDKTLTDKLAQHTTEMEAIKKEIYDKLDEASQANPNLELVDAREGETTLKENLNKNYTKKSELEPLQTSISELTDTTTALRGRTDKLEQYVTKHPNPVLTINKQSPDDTGNIDISGGNIEATEVTYEELTQLTTDSKLVTGGIYLLTDYKTIYQQPISNEIKSGETEELYLTATSTNTLSPIAYSKKYPEDIIIYDIDNKIAEDDKTPRPGFILRRTDTVNHLSAPQDWRAMLWKRYDISDTHYFNGTDNVPYEVWQSGQEVKLNGVYKIDNKLYLAFDSGVPLHNTDNSYFICICEDITNLLYVADSVSSHIDIMPNVSLLTGNGDHVPTFGEGCKNIYIDDIFNNAPHNNVFKKNCRNIELANDCRHNSFDRGSKIISLGNQCNRNTMTFASGLMKLGSNSTDNFIIDSNLNILGNSCSNNTLIHGGNNVFHNINLKNILINSHRNILAMDSSANTFINSSENILDTNCQNNSFGRYANYNTLGSDCDYNVFEKHCNGNNLGILCRKNTFQMGSAENTLGQYCYYNAFGTECKYNVLGAECTKNKFGAECISITMGSYCQENKLSNGCQYVRFGSACTHNECGEDFRNSEIQHNCTYNIFGNACFSIFLTSDNNMNNFGYHNSQIIVIGKCFKSTFANHTQRLVIYDLFDKDVSNIETLTKPQNTVIQQGVKGTLDYQYYYSQIEDGTTVTRLIP